MVGRTVTGKVLHRDLSGNLTEMGRKEYSGTERGSWVTVRFFFLGWKGPERTYKLRGRKGREERSKVVKRKLKAGEEPRGDGREKGRMSPRV